MEERLCEAAITGNTDSLHSIFREHPLILDKVAAGCFNGASPLHVATLCEQANFVKELLGLKPQLTLKLTEVLDSQLRSALHLASAKGYDEIVKVLVAANPDMCLVRDRDGKNPLHVAAAKGKINVLKALVGACPQAIRDRADQNQTILHLCVKHNQLESLQVLLETLQGEELVNAKDNDGNTVLHLAIMDKRFEMVELVLKNQAINENGENASGRPAMHILSQVIPVFKKIFQYPITRHVPNNQTTDVNVENASGHTAMDSLIRVQARSVKDVPAGECPRDTPTLAHIEGLLRGANAKQAKELVGGQWLTKKRDSLMVVASLLATMAFQAGLSPPGGVWQDNLHGHRAGEAIMAYNYKDSYPIFLRLNTISFVASLSTILLLISGLKFRNKATMWILIISMWLAITSMAITYAYSNVVITPKRLRRPLTNTIVIAVIVWSSVMTLLLLRYTCQLVAIYVEEHRSATKRMRECKKKMANNRV